MSIATKDFLGRSDRELALVLSRYEQLHNSFGESDPSHVNSCFKVAAYELLTEDQWKKLLNRTRQLLDKMNKS